MADFPYILTPNKISQFLRMIQSGAVPNKVSQDFLIKTGFRSKNDRALIPVMKFIGFVDSSGIPTDRWRKYRDRQNARSELANAVRDAYGSLFAIYPDAHKRDMDTLRNFFSASTKVGERAVAAIVSTFQVLAKEADFDGYDAMNPQSSQYVDTGPGYRSGPQSLFPPSSFPPTGGLVHSATQGAEKYEGDGLFILIRPTPKNVERARRFLDLVELGIGDKDSASQTQSQSVEGNP